MAKDVKEHSADFFKIVAAAGTVMAVSLGGMKMCGAPWDPPIANARQELRKEARDKHEKMKDATDKEHDEIEETFEKHEGVLNEKMQGMDKKIDRLLYWGREERNGR